MNNDNIELSREDLLCDIWEADPGYRNIMFENASNTTLHMIREMSLLRKELYEKIDNSPEEDFNALDEEYLGKLLEIFKEYGYDYE